MNGFAEAVLTITNDLGLHARAATVFVQLASKFESDIYVTKDGREVNGKSIMGILTLVASRGSQITLRTFRPAPLSTKKMWWRKSAGRMK